MKIQKFVTLGVLALLLAAPGTANAADTAAAAPLEQAQTRRISGVVLDDSDGSPLIGVVVQATGSKAYSVTDIDGQFSINVPASCKELTFTMVGFKDEVCSTASSNVTVRMKTDAEMLNEVQVIAYGTQSKMTITGSIASIGNEELLKSPSASAGAALAGAVTGISSVQVSGQPGAEDPQIYVRGAGSLTDEASRPLILVDGVERSFFQMDPNEIESITVLKDAASTAVFGVRGANGVILVTTRRGEKGKVQFTVTSSAGLTQPLRNLDMLDSYTYACMYTEAQRADNPLIPDNSLMFSPQLTEMFRTHQDPIMFPDVDWNDYLMKKLAWQTQHNITLSGGSDKINYFVSMSYLHQDGLLKQMMLEYDPNFMYNRYNYRVNLDIHPTNTTTIRINVGGRLGNRREPNNYAMWQNLMWCTPFASPGYVDDTVIANSNNKYIPMSELLSGMDLYYGWGYNTNTENVMNLDLAVEQNLDMVTKGLSFNVKGAYNFNSSLSTNRGNTGSKSAATPIYLGTLLTPELNIYDKMFDNTIVYQTEGITEMWEPMSYSEGSWGGRNWYLEGSFNYARTFGEHSVTGLLLYNQSKTYYPGAYNDIPTAYVGYVGRVTYSFKNRYLADFNIGYNGSENFAPGKRYGLFPAGSIGWIASDEPWVKKLRIFDFLKFRASYGLVGNDKYSGDRFLYIDGTWNGAKSVWGGGGSYRFGIGDTNSYVLSTYENSLGNPDVTWEKCSKQNYGVDMKLFNYRLSLTAEVFFEHRWDILSKRNTLPGISAVNLPMINLGIVDNHGYEISLGWNETKKDFNYYATLNLSYAKNEIIYKDEVTPNFPWMAETGGSTGRNYGYLLDRFLQPGDFDADGNLMLGNFNADGVYEGIPSMSLGTPRPGDALFKDLNHDGKIDGNDKTWFGYGTRPEYVVGLVCGFSWKGFGVSMQWTGATHADRLLSGEYRAAFGTQNCRALLSYLANERCCEENGYNGKFPRLTFASKDHYMLTSDVWMLDGSYLRLKTAEISYTFKNSLLNKVGIDSAKLYVNGYNLCTLFSELDEIDIDPEGLTGGSSANSYAYPNSRIYNLGVNLSF